MLVNFENENECDRYASYGCELEKKLCFQTMPFL